MGNSKRRGYGLFSVSVSLLLVYSLLPTTVFGQAQDQAGYGKIQDIIQRSESTFRDGEHALVGGDRELARKKFDEAVDVFLTSGVIVRNYPTLDSYYRSLVERIHLLELAGIVPQTGRAQRTGRVPEFDRVAHSENAPEIDRVKAGVPEFDRVSPSPAVPRPEPFLKKEAAPPTEPEEEAVESAVLDELSDVEESELATVTPGGIRVFGRYDFQFSVAAPVFQYINYFVGGRGRSTMEVGLRRSGRYRDMAERIFKEERVPLDLIWLAQAESVWKPRALSRAAAKGIWQFIPSTGLRYGLAQTPWVDERSNPEKSTRAAARYLRFLHDYFAGDWLLAMAAYNSGEGRVEATIAKSGYADFWEIHRQGYLPAETRNYVPIILSIIIISKNQKRYDFDVKPDPPLTYDRFELPGQTDLRVVSELLNLPYEMIQDLNPELRRGTSPPGQRYTIKLPKGTRKQFEFAYSRLPEDQRVRKVLIPSDEVADTRRTSYRTRVVSYRVRSGDTLTGVARKHGVSVQELARMNRISPRTKLRKGQSVKVPQSVRAVKSQKSKTSKKKSAYSEKKASRGSKSKSASKTRRR